MSTDSTYKFANANLQTVATATGATVVDADTGEVLMQNEPTAFGTGLRSDESYEQAVALLANFNPQIRGVLATPESIAKAILDASVTRGDRENYSVSVLEAKADGVADNMVTKLVNDGRKSPNLIAFLPIDPNAGLYDNTVPYLAIVETTAGSWVHTHIGPFVGMWFQPEATTVDMNDQPITVSIPAWEPEAGRIVGASGNINPALFHSVVASWKSLASAKAAVRAIKDATRAVRAQERLTNAANGDADEAVADNERRDAEDRRLARLARQESDF